MTSPMYLIKTGTNLVLVPGAPRDDLTFTYRVAVPNKINTHSYPREEESEWRKVG